MTVDKDNICIQLRWLLSTKSAIIEPDMFKCAIVMGVYDLPLMYEAIRKPKTVIGTDEAELKAFSPAYNHRILCMVVK